MEDLNKSQLILLAILVSFVTSIATGIFTVALLDEQSPTVTQTINRVVERTVEKVVPGETKTVVKEVPVIVTEEELIVKVVNSASGAVGLVHHQLSLNGALGLAFIVDGGNYAITSTDVLIGEGVKNPGPYDISLEDGTHLDAQLVAMSADKKIAALKITNIIPAEKSNLLNSLVKSTPTLKGVKLSKTVPAVGQTVVALGSISNDASPVAVGIVSSLNRAGNSTSTISFKTNAVNKDNLGGPLFTIQGEVAGLNISPGLAVPAALIKALIDSIK